MRMLKCALMAMLALAVLALPIAGAADAPKPVEVDTAPGIMAVDENILAPVEVDTDSDIMAVDVDVDEGADLNAGFAGGEAAFSKFSGEITMIDMWDGQQFIRVTNAEGGDTDFVINAGLTAVSDLDGLIGADALAVGADVDAYYTAPLIVSLQYPARYTAAVIVIKDDSSPGAAFVGIVNDEGRASDGSIVLNIFDETRLAMQSGGAAPGSGGGMGASAVMGRAVIAYYAVTTRSLPPIALVDSAVILDKLGVPVFVNGAKLYGAEAFIKPDGTVMAPLRAIVEALGHDVAWDADTNTARVGVAIYVAIGSDEYAVGRAVPTKLEAAAELINDRTYAPLSFYTQILNIEASAETGLLQLAG